MKIKFIPLLFVLGCIASNSQITTTGGAKFFVSQGTTLYSTGDITIESSSDVFTNKGNIKISDGTLKNNSLPKNFVLSYDDEQKYGQLIIATNKRSVGTITLQKKLPDGTGTSGEILFGTPFINYTYDQFVKDVSNSSINAPDLICGLFSINNNCGGNATKWLKHPVFTWREDRFRFDPFQKDEKFIPGKHYSFRAESFASGSNLSDIISFIGSPYVAGTSPNDGGVSSNLSLSVIDRIGTGYQIGSNSANGYGIYYWTYLNDPFVPGITFNQSTTNDELNNANYWTNMLRMVNPYTSNLDINELLKENIRNNEIIGIGSDGNIMERVVDGYTRYKTKYQRQTFSPDGKALGDDLSVIPPMTNFFIKTIPNSRVKVNLYTNSSIQTFKSSNYKFDKGNVYAKGSEQMNRSSAYSVNNEKYQLNLELYSGNTFYGNTYVAAGSDLITGEVNKWEATGLNNNDDTSIYTIPESNTGGIQAGYENTKLYINVINSNDASRIAIPVGINLNDNDKGNEFTFKSELKLNMVPLVDEGKTNFDNSNAKFYFHDKLTNVVKEIDTNFTYSTKLNESTNDRFEIFWKEPGTLGNEDINALSGLTTIYKTGNEYKVKFDKNWQKAEVNIFNVLGQLISTEKNINTNNDYLLPIYTTSSSLYVIVVINQITGEKITKKIVK